MTDTGFWDELTQRFERETGIRTELVETGPKHFIAPAFIDGQADLITMHASDTIINLVADGYGIDPQPWLKNDLLLVGPKADPAGIQGERNPVAALAKIIDSGSTILVHRSLGATEVLHDLLAAGELELDPAHTVTLPSDRHRQLLQKAAAENAYTLVGRIPFLNGKIASGGLEIMVAGDPRMRRPYVVVVTSQSGPRQEAAKRLAQFLREEKTQAWIAEFGRGIIDDQPLFFRVALPK
jgi:tungstate transport system substrate-binding protein